ncbi:hypothetical protein HDU67_000771 [Dinochytrium kinnereticum]|nr:hypothetical protein HDU67_000771 [Dinochytrium kinnereticum]
MSRGRDDLFSNCEVEILLPATNSSDPVDICNAGRRSFAVFDEILHFYLLLKPSPQSQTAHGRSLKDDLEALATTDLDIQVSATLISVPSAGNAKVDTEIATKGDNRQQSRPGSITNIAQTSGGSTLISSPNDIGPSTTSMNPPPTAYSPTRPRAISSAPTQQGASPLQHGATSPPVHRRSTSLRHSESAGPSFATTKSLSEAGQYDGGYRSDSFGAGSRVANEDVIYSYAYNPALEQQRPIIVNDGASGGSTAPFCLFPLRLPVDISKARPSENSLRLLSVTVTIQQSIQGAIVGGFAGSREEFCDLDDFDYCNLFDALAEDPYFNPENFPVHRLPHQYRKQSMMKNMTPPKVLRVTIPVYPPLTLRVFLSRISPDCNLISLNVKNSLASNSPEASSANLVLHSVTMEVINGVILSEGKQKFPVVMSPLDETGFLFTSTLLEDATLPLNGGGALSPLSRSSAGSKSHHAPDFHSSPSASFPLRASIMTKDRSSVANVSSLSIVIESSPGLPGLQDQIISSRRHYNLDVLSYEQFQNFISPSRGIFTPRRVLGSTIEKNKINNLLDISFSGLNTFVNDSLTPVFPVHLVVEPVRIQEIFTVQVFVVNRSKSEQSLTLKIPRKLRGRDKGSDPIAAEGLDHILGLGSKDMIHAYMMDDKHEAAIICVESSITFEKLLPGTCETAHFHLIAIKGKFHVVDVLQIIGNQEGEKVEMKGFIQIHVEEALPQVIR